MRIFIGVMVIAAVVGGIGSGALADEAKDAAVVSGRVLILKQSTNEPVGSVNGGGLIVVEIPDSGSRPPQEIKVDGGKCSSLGHVRGVATNKDGRPMMGGGYYWYLFKAPTDVRSVAIDASYMPNGMREPKRTKRHYVVPIEK